MLDAVVENLVVESENLMPNILEIQADTFFRFGRKKIHNRNQHRFSVHASQIQCDLKDVAYYIKKKQGFPSIKDTGLMDIFLGGEGLSFDMRLATAQPKDRNRIFLVENVNVKIRNLNIVLKKSNHKTLFNFFKPLLMGVMKPAIAKAAEMQIRKSFDQLDEQMWLVQKEYNKAKEAAKDQPPEETANMFKMYINAIEKRITELKEKAEKTTSNTKVTSCRLYYANPEINVANTRETSLFPNIQLPGATSTKATKYREMAREGDEWRSPVFDLGTAKTASNIPAPKKITRRSPHQNTRATINDRPGTVTHGPGGQSVGPSSDSSEPQIGSGTSGMRGQQDSRLDSGAGYTSLNSGGFDSTTRSTGSSAGYIPSMGGYSSSSNGYQPRMSTATDSMSTAVEHDNNDFEGTHVGKYNVSGSQLAQDPISMPYSGAKDTHVATQDPSPRAY